MPELAPDGSPLAVIQVLKGLSAQHIALAGHEPNLSALLAACILGTGSRPFTKMKKGGTACICYSGKAAAGAALLTEFAPPRLLRAG